MEETLVHQRMYHDKTHTMGYIIFSNKINYILEDTKQKVKIKGKTRIPAGKYELKFRKEVSGLTQTYRDIYPWFEYHIELQDVPGFQYVYDHIGNYDKDTDGCRLHGTHPTNPRFESIAMVRNSKMAFKDYYEYVAMLLNKGVKVYTLILDEIEDV